jgi:hypothetical protein
MTNSFRAPALRLGLVLLAFQSIGSAVLSAATITNVFFTGSAANPTINIVGTGFGSAPASTSTATAGFTGLDYGTIFYLIDQTFNPTAFSAGFDNPSLSEHDLIGFANLSYTNTLISFNFGSEYTTTYFPTATWELNSGDKFLLTVAGSTFSGTVAYPAATTVPEPTSAAYLGVSGLGLLAVLVRKARRS